MDDNVQVFEQHNFFDGLRVLAVDDDATCLTIVKKMLQLCRYKVTTCAEPDVALSILRDRKGEFDLVLTNVRMPNMEGFKLLEHVVLEFGLPVIMMSADNQKEVILRGLEQGACLYLTKPIQMVELRSIWQHVYGKKYSSIKESEQVEDSENNGQKKGKDIIQDEQESTTHATERASSANKKKMKHSNREMKENKDEDEKDSDDAGTSKKARVVWHPELHLKFMNVVERIGVDKAVPKKILELMNIPGLTRENVASHLQKYRLSVKRDHEPSNPFLDEYRNNCHGQLRSNGGTIPRQMMLNKQEQPCLSQFSEQSNRPTELQPGFIGNPQISLAPMTTPPNNYLTYLTEQAKNNFSVNRSRHGSSLQSNQDSLNQILQGNNLQTKASYFHQIDGNLGFGALLQQNQRMGMQSHGGISTGQMKSTDNGNVLDQQYQVRQGFFENRKVDNFSMQNVNSTNNYIDTQLQRSRGQLGSNQIGLTQTGKVGEPSNTLNSTSCEAAISIKGKDLLILEGNSNFSYDTYGLGNSHGLPNINQVPRMYKHSVPQPCDLTSEYNLEAGAEILSNFIKRSTIQSTTLPQQLSTSDIDNMIILNKNQDLIVDANIMPEFDISEYHLGDNHGGS